MLDLITQAQIWNFLLEEAARRELGLLIVSHTPALLERLCHRHPVFGPEFGLNQSSRPRGGFRSAGRPFPFSRKFALPLVKGMGMQYNTTAES